MDFLNMNTHIMFTYHRKTESEPYMGASVNKVLVWSRSLSVRINSPERIAQGCELEIR